MNTTTTLDTSATTDTATQDSAALVQALANVWAAIRARHASVPDVMITLGSGSAGSRSSLTLGHFAASRWVRGEASVHEFFIGGEGLERGPRETLGTMLHEAAHGMAQVRGIKDTSRQGRYHNREFQALANEIGIEVTHSRELGYSTTTVPDVTAEAYAAEIAELSAAITAYRRRDGFAVVTGGSGGPQGGGTNGGRTSSNNGQALVCECGRRIRAAHSVIALGPILCGVCATPFTAPVV
jgi:hypothetical protein